MSDHYKKELTRIAVAQICQTIGYNATQTAPLELLQDVLDKFLKEFTRDLRRQVEHDNRIEANLNDVALTLKSINVNPNELLDYINNVEPVPFALEVPKFPARKDSALNFLKPGSKEVLTRPVHVHDHLPPMLPPEITQPAEMPLVTTDTKENLSNGDQSNETGSKPLNASSVLDKSTLQSLFKPSTNFEDGERPTREVSSVVMTTGGYISPAVEGKMPEAVIPDIIDKLLGFDAPPPPTPPPPPPPPPQPKPVSRSTTPGPMVVDSTASTLSKETMERENTPSTSKEAKKNLVRNLEHQPLSHKKLKILHDVPNKKNKFLNSSSGKNFPNDSHLQAMGAFNKKSFMMHQNASNMQTPQTNYANMLLKKAKKQKIPIISAQPLNEKHNKPLVDKMGKMDAAEKTHRKYMKMLQKLAKQGKIPPEILSNIIGPDKKSKMINPAIVAGMPPGPEKLQLEKLLRKQAKQSQKMHKQQMMLEKQKQSKKPLQQLPPLVPIFPPRMTDNLTKPLNKTLNKPMHLVAEEQKVKIEPKNIANITPVKPAFNPNQLTPTACAAEIMPLSNNLLAKANKTHAIPQSPALEIMDNNNKPLLTGDGKELKLNNEPDRSKLNIFKKISKQKTTKSSSPTPMRVTAPNETSIISLPSGTTITPAPGPSNATDLSPNLTATPVGRNLFLPLPDNAANNANTNIINVDDVKNKTITAPPVNSSQPTDLTMLNRVFGEKPPEVELINKPKKRGRKPGSKNTPKIPGVFPNNLLKKNSKKMKLNSGNMFPPQIAQLPADFGGPGMANLSFDNVAQLFGNPISPLEWAQNKHLQQQMMIMAGAKERKEHKKKTKMLKQQDILLAADNNKMPNMTNLNTNAPLNMPTNEEVQSINKKLMRMDTILKAAPSTGSSQDLTVDTSLITGKKLPSPSMFPSSTSPLKSPGNSKRLMAGAEAMASSLQPFMLPQPPAFPNLPSNMLSMLQFPFTARPGLIPAPGLFPTPGLGTFPNNPKNPLLSGLFPFSNLKQTMVGENPTMSQESEDLTINKKSDTNLQTAERSYCNVAPLVPDFLTKLNDSTNNNNNTSNSSNTNKHSHEPPHAHGPDLPKTPKPRNSSNLSQDNFKKIIDAHTPESGSGSLSGKSMSSTPGSMSLNAYEQLLKKQDSPLDLMSFNKHNKSLSASQESGLDFSMNKKTNHNLGMGGIVGGLSIKPPITLNNEPIEVSDDSDEANQPLPRMPTPTAKAQPSAALSVANLSSQPTHAPAHSNFNMDDMFIPNTNSTHMLSKSMETDLSTKELKKLKKQVKKTSSNITASLINTDKSGGLVTNQGPTATTTGVGKLAGGADLIPLPSTGMAYSSKNIPYNSLTANANPSFIPHKTDFTSSSPASSNANMGSSVFDNLTITAAIPPPSSSLTSTSTSMNNSSNTAFDLQKKRKEHKKLKKLKELKDGKIKKKKDKKDKNKSKEKVEKYLLSHSQTTPTKEKPPTQTTPEKNFIPTTVTAILPMSHSSNSSIDKIKDKDKDKDILKKLKKEKKKDKQRSAFDEQTTQNPSILQQTNVAISNSTSKDHTAYNTVLNVLPVEVEQTKKQKSPSALTINTKDHQETPAGLSSLNTSSATASLVPKLTLKLGSTHSPTPPKDDSHKTTSLTGANISAQPLTATIVTASPTQEPPREPSPELARISPLVTRPPKHKLNTSGELAASSSSTSTSISAANASSLDIVDNSKATSNTNMIVPPPSPWLSGGTISASSVLLPHQLLQTTKQHDISNTLANSTHNTDSNSKSNTVDRQQSPLTLLTETNRPSSYIDAEGTRIWICPACAKVDDGSPMIGCDGCDAWYHWICVGILVAPNDNEDWFCRACITRKMGLHGSDKKRKRNKKK